jgi:hypothetical protein
VQWLRYIPTDIIGFIIMRLSARIGIPPKPPTDSRATTTAICNQ